MRQRLTNKLKSLISQIQNDVIEKGNPEIVPEHYLIAILQESSFTLCKVLTETEYEILVSRVADVLDQLPHNTQTPPQYAVRMNVVFSFAEDLRRRGNEAYLSVDHITLGLLNDTIVANLVEAAVPPAELASRIKEKHRHASDPSADDSENPIAAFAVEMVAEARKGIYDPVIGRVDEIRTVLEILGKKKKANPLLVGPAGVGKTAIVCALAQMVADDKALSLQNAKIYNVDLTALIANSCMMGQFEEKLKRVLKEAERSPNVILFIDEIHRLITITSRGLDIANMLKPQLASGAIRCIGATTFEEYHEHIEKDSALERRFVKVVVNEPTIEDSVTMLRGLRSRFEAHHGTKILDSAITFAVTMGKKRIPGRRLPDVAIDIIDTACASAVIAMQSEPQEILTQRNKIWSLELQETAQRLDLQRHAGGQNAFEIQQTHRALEYVQQQLVADRAKLQEMEEQHQKDRQYVIETRNIKKRIEDCKIRLVEAERLRDHYKALEIRDDILPVLEAKLQQLEAAHETAEVITPAHAAEIISRWTEIPVGRLTLDENERLLAMGDRLRMAVFGQDHAIDAVAHSIWRSRMGMGDPDRPIGSFLFLGPSGVGKTELAKALSYELFDDSKQMVILNMSDYRMAHAVTKLVGVSAGYVGYGDGGTLTEPVRNKPYNVVLLDEIDHAHQATRNLLYQVLDEGRIVDGKGNMVDFTNCVIIMTSNIGQQELLDEQSYLDSSDGKILKPEVERAIELKLNEAFGTPLVNRIGKIAYFNRLDEQILEMILDKELAKLNRRYQVRNVTLKLEPEVRSWIMHASFDPKYGARPLKKNMDNIFTTAVTKILLKNDFNRKVVIVASTEEGERVDEFYYRWHYVDDE